MSEFLTAARKLIYQEVDPYIFKKILVSENQNSAEGAGDSDEVMVSD
jgi:hypothetical protein